MRILIACEFSGVVRDAFAAKGFEAWSCDLLPSETPTSPARGTYHYQGDGPEGCFTCGGAADVDWVVR